MNEETKGKDKSPQFGLHSKSRAENSSEFEKNQRASPALSVKFEDVAICTVCQSEISSSDRKELDIESWRRLIKFDCSDPQKRVLHKSCFEECVWHSSTDVRERVLELSILARQLALRRELELIK